MQERLHFIIYSLHSRWLISQTNCYADVSKEAWMSWRSETIFWWWSWSEALEKKNKNTSTVKPPPSWICFEKKKKKNIGRLLNLAQRSRMISTKAWNLLFYAQLNFVTRCAPAVCSALCFCARWAIRNMVIACWAATHTLAATVATCGESTCYNTHIIYFIQGLCHWASSSIVSLGNICKELWVQ